jgi:carbon monoxide dehydrogenase subunit G
MHHLSINRRLIILTLAALALVFAVPAKAQEVAVQVQKNGDAFEVRAEFRVPATVTESWEVLTDYDNMAKIVSNVDASRIQNRNGNTFEVAQKSHVKAGLLSISLDSVRQVTLTPPKEIKSTLLKGNLKSSDFVTRVFDEGAQTKVTAEGTFVPTALGAATISVDSVVSSTRQQYKELRDEILRRKNGQPTPPCILAKNCQQSSG